MTDTPATAALAATDVEHDIVAFGRVSSLEEAAAAVAIPVERFLKTLVIRRSEDDHLFVLVPGHREIDWPKLRTHLGVNRVSMPSAEEAREVTGYERGTITPFGSRTSLPVIVDASVPTDGQVAIGGGAHGVELVLGGADLIAALDAEVADVTSAR